MDAREPITIVIGRFEDLIARGLRSLIAEDANIELLADGVDLDAFEPTLGEHEPKVAIVNFGSLRTPMEVNRLHTKHPDTRLLVLANRPTPWECNQMLAFGATACLSKETEARDILNAIHLASTASTCSRVRPAASLASRSGRNCSRHAKPTCSSTCRRGAPTPRSRWALSVSVETVRAHRRNVYRKLGVRTRRELASLSRRGRARARAAADDLRSVRGTGEPPAIADRATLRTLAERHVVVLDASRPCRDGTPVRGARRRSTRRGRRRVWRGDCAWDAFGIVAALGLRDALVADAGGRA